MEFKDSNNSRGFTEGAMKVNAVRTSSAKNAKKIRFLASVAFFGLSAFNAPYALIGGGITVASFGFSIQDGEINILKSNAIKHKFNRIAKKFKKLCGINIRPQYNYETRQAGFVLCDLSGKIPITSFLTSENVSEYLNPEQIETLQVCIDDEFANMNSYRGKGEYARKIRERKFRNSSKIGFDNLTCAFDNVGGVLTNKELMTLSMGNSISRIEYKKFMNKHKHEELWTFSSHLSTYLEGLTDLNAEEKRDILKEFEWHFEKYGQEGKCQFQKLNDQIDEMNEMKRMM